MKKILFLGDIVGEPGRKFVIEKARDLRESLSLDFLIVNGENAAGGSGINKNIAEKLIGAGVDGITLGDHIWDQKGFEKDIDSIDLLCRPANIPIGSPGKSHIVITDKDGFRLLIFTVLGNVFISAKASCPFRAAQEMLEKNKGLYDGAICEIHAEATSEKIAMGYFLDGKTIAVVGSHTHVATADEQILDNGTAFQCDLGMCGPHDGVIGRKKELVVARFFDGMPRRLEVCSGKIEIHGLLISYDENEKKCISVERYSLIKEDAGE